MENMDKIALDIRRKIYKIVCTNKCGHLASSLSSVDIMVALYFGGILNYDPQDPNWDNRDRFILSKGHSALCLYSILSKAGYFAESELKEFCMLGTKLGALPLKGKVPGIEATTGSLGHGISFAAGIAKYGKIFNKDYKTYVLAGDGELQEGEVWEATLFGSQNKLDNLIIIIDNNRIQATGFTGKILDMMPLKDKFQAFGCEVYEIDGHNIKDILNVMEISQGSLNGKMKVIIANTIKGNGISYIENQGNWHYKIPNEEQIQIGIKDLKMTKEEFDLLL